MNSHEIGTILIQMLTDNSGKELSSIDKMTDLFEAEILDSFQVISLVVQMEEKFGVILDESDVTEDNFKSLESLADMIIKRIGTPVI